MLDDGSQRRHRRGRARGLRRRAARAPADLRERRQGAGAQPRPGPDPGRHRRGARRRHPVPARHPAAPGALVRQSEGRRGGRQRHRRQPPQPHHPLAGAGICHRPEPRAAGAGGARRGDGGAGRGRGLAARGAHRARRLSRTTPWPRTRTSPWRSSAPAGGWSSNSSARAYTEAPDTVQGLLNQRFRWSLRHPAVPVEAPAPACSTPKHPVLGFVALPQIWLFQIVLTVAAPLVDLAIVSSLAWAVYAAPTIPVEWSPDDTVPLGVLLGRLHLPRPLGRRARHGAGAQGAVARPRLAARSSASATAS